MKIVTQFDIGDTIWYLTLINHKAVPSIVQGVIIEVRADGDLINQKITYLLNSESGARVNLKMESPNCFKSKEELLASL